MSSTFLIKAFLFIYFSTVAEYLGLGLFEPPVEKKNEIPRINADTEYSYAPPENRPGHDPGVPTLSEGKMRIQEQGAGRTIPQPQPGFGKHGMFVTDLASQVSVSPGHSGSVLPRPGTLGYSASPRSRSGSRSTFNAIPRKENIKPANPFSETPQGNPFGSPTSDESLGEDNPFAKGSVPSKAAKLLGDGNPFGGSPSPQPEMSSKAKQLLGDADYDEEKNPFS